MSVQLQYLPCPVCGSPDTRHERTYDEEGGIFYCTNLACASNGGPNASALVDARVQAAKVIHDMLATLPPGSWPEPAAHGIQALRKIAQDAREREDQPRGVVVECASRFDSLGCNVTLSDGTPIGHMITKLRLDIEAGELNKLTMELSSPLVIAKVLDVQAVLDLEEAVKSVRQSLRQIFPVTGPPPMMTVDHDLRKIEEGIQHAKQLLMKGDNGPVADDGPQQGGQQ